MADPLYPSDPPCSADPSSAPPPILVLEGLCRSFGASPAVDEVSLIIREGEFFSLLGPSGCGKTTLLRMIAGFESPDRGSIRLDGRELTGLPPYLRPVNMMFQSYALFPHMSVEKNIAYGLKSERLSRPEIAARVQEVLQLVRLDGLARRRPHQLSGGERQRVALARCLAKKPRMLLLDEPLAALDKRLREEMRIELVQIQRRLRTTFIMVTHDQQEALGVSTRIAVMRAGRILQVGTPLEVYESPVCRFVASFLGDANLFEGVVASDPLSGATFLEGAVTGTGLRCPAPANGLLGRPAVLAIRPERVSVYAVPPSGGENCLPGSLLDIGYQGPLSVFRVRLRGGTIALAVQTNTRRPDHPVKPGDDVYVCWTPEAGVLMRHD